MVATEFVGGARETRARWTAIAVAAVAALGLAGCGGSDGDDAGAPRGERSPAPRSTSPSPSASASKPSFSAADGHDVHACADGDCEITVSDPVSFHFKAPKGTATLSMTEVGRNKVEYTVKSGAGQSKGGAEGAGFGCLTVLREHGSGNSCGGVGDAARPSPQPDAVVIQVAAGEDGTALVQIVSP